MLCKKCSHEIPEGALFCTNCGASAAESAAENISQQTETQSPIQNEQSTSEGQPVNTYSQNGDSAQAEKPQWQYGKQPTAPEQNPYMNNSASGTAPNYYGGAQTAQQPTGSPYVSHYGNPTGGGMNARYNEQYHQTYGAQPPRTTTNPASSPAPAPVTPYNQTAGGHVSVGAWIGVILLNCVPLVNLIMLFVWAFGGTTKPSLKNYARASLILWAIALVLFIILFVILLIIGINIFDSSTSWSWSKHYYF